MARHRNEARQRMRAAAYVMLDAAFAGHGVPRTVNGQRIRFPAKWCRYYPTTYERKKHEFLVERCRPGSTVIDGGAHIGLFTVAMARAVGPSGRVVAFEPTPATRSVLSRTVALNDVAASVSVRDEALTSVTSRMTLHVAAVEGSNSNSLIGVAPGGVEEEVPTLALDDLAPTLPSPVSCIKLDIEGAELDALVGAEELLQQQGPALCIEVHPTVLRSADRDPGGVRDLLLDLGYALRDGRQACRLELFDGDEPFEFQATRADPRMG